MFRNFKHAIAAFYVATVLLTAVGLYFLVVILQQQNFLLILSLTLGASLVLGLIIAKVAIEPLEEYFHNLESFSKETLHELNLPISTITANTQMLRRGCSDEKSLSRIGRIEAACDKLKERYGELDYLIKRQMNKEQRESVELAAFIADRIDAVRPLYPQVCFEEELEKLTLTLDKIGLGKVIDNLVENAVKYSHNKGRITIALSGRKLKIRDNGIGMSEFELFRIFDRYYQNDASMPGFGIGLGMVKSYCDKERIKLHVASKQHEGTTVTLDFSEVN